MLKLNFPSKQDNIDNNDQGTAKGEKGMLLV